MLGEADGDVWLVLHGGPGSGAQPGMARPFDLSRQRLVLPDQRGAGASRPRGATRRNHTLALVADLEALRQQLGLDRWSVLAGSWGTVLALAYAQAHPQRVQRLVLRAAFALSRREVSGLLLPHGASRRQLGGDVLGPLLGVRRLPAVLARTAQLLQSATLGVTALGVLHRWQWLEAQAAGRGLRRSLQRARGLGRSRLASAIGAELMALRRRQRRQRALWDRPRAMPADRALWRKLRIQAHYLRHRGFIRPGALDAAVLALARAAVPVDWVHGVCDAVCPPANSRRWAALGQGVPGASVKLHMPLSGHLGGEPDMERTLQRVVQMPLTGGDR